MIDKVTSTSERAHAWLRRVLRPFRRVYIPEMLTLSLVIASTAIGVSLILEPHIYREQTSFAGILQYASPEVWGGLVITLALVLGWTVLIDRASAYLPALMTTWLWGIWGLLTLGTVPADAATAADATLYVLMTWLHALVGLVYWSERA